MRPVYAPISSSHSIVHGPSVRCNCPLLFALLLHAL